MLIKELLSKINLGSTVAENEEYLENYFLKTRIFDKLIKDEIDIIAGAKGTGKSAIYQYVTQNYRNIKDLENVEIIPAINPTGDPVFKIVTDNDNISAAQFTDLWKWYLFSLVGNKMMDIYEAETSSEHINQLEYILSTSKLRLKDPRPRNAFEHLVNWFRKVVKPSSLEGGISIDASTGLPVLSAKANYSTEGVQETKVELITADKALTILNNILIIKDFRIWVFMDRLDEAFHMFSQVGNTAIRSLFRAYLHFTEFTNIKLKIFVRNDIFRKINTPTPFINLTHIRKGDIIWYDEDLFELLHKRIRSSQSFMDILSLQNHTRDQLFGIFFPDKMGKGVSTLNWMLSRIRDGNNIKSPRNLIDMVSRSIEEQEHLDLYGNREYSNDNAILSVNSIKNAHVKLSQDRVIDTLPDEAGEYSQIIEQFRNSKSEHNFYSISSLLNITVLNEAGKPDPERAALQINNIIDVLAYIGFLEPVKTTYKIPWLYRPGLNISGGKAF